MFLFSSSFNSTLTSYCCGPKDNDKSLANFNKLSSLKSLVCPYTSSLFFKIRRPTPYKLVKLLLLHLYMVHYLK